MFRKIYFYTIFSLSFPFHDCLFTASKLDIKYVCTDAACHLGLQNGMLRRKTYEVNYSFIASYSLV